MTSLFALRALLFAGELLAASLLILALVWLVASPRTASARHLAWAGAFGVLLALPALAALLPSMTQILLPAAPALPPMPMSRETLVMAPVAAPLPSGFDFDSSDIVLALGALWLAGVVLILGRFAIGGLCLALLKRRSRPFALAPGDEPKVAARGQECELRLCERDTGPITWGIFRPIILLPRTALAWPRERLHAVLLHELAHIRRRDSLANALSHAACALYWPNPLVWIAAARLRREAEIAADDAVLNTGIKPSTYAGELLALAQEFRTRQAAFAGMAIFMAQPSSLEARVESVLAPTQQRSGVTSMDVLKIAGLGLCAATAIALACPSLAQETAPPAASSENASVTSAELPPPVRAAEPAPTAAEASAQSEAAPAEHRHHHVYVAEDVPPAPSAPPTPPTPAAPSAAAVPPMPATPPAPAQPADPSTHVWMEGHQLWADGPNVKIDGSHMNVDGHNIWVDGHRLDEMSPADRQRLHEEIENARRQAHEAMEKARPEIEKAMAQVRASEEAMRAARPQIERAQAEVARHQMEIQRAEAEVARHRMDIERAEQAMRDAKPQIDAAVAEMAKHKGEIEAAMAKVQPEIDAAMAKVREEMAKQHINVKIDERVDEALKRAEIRIRAAEKHSKDVDQDDDSDARSRVEQRSDSQDER
ncbi:MAG TPA: M56 family metallopeptidase [Rhizomicrobium sp.]|nr:M56 family metallopeptidase [Rhizomicrobium sp.]